MDFFKWLNDQLLRMDWLAWLVRALLEDGFGMDISSRVGAWPSSALYMCIRTYRKLMELPVRQMPPPDVAA
ncbi:MAG: hypothetical protein QNL70_11965 [Pseudomonas sp.]